MWFAHEQEVASGIVFVIGCIMYRLIFLKRSRTIPPKKFIFITDTGISAFFYVYICFKVLREFHKRYKVVTIFLVRMCRMSHYKIQKKDE